MMSPLANQRVAGEALHRCEIEQSQAAQNADLSAHEQITVAMVQLSNSIFQMLAASLKPVCSGF